MPTGPTGGGLRRGGAILHARAGQPGLPCPGRGGVVPAAADTEGSAGVRPSRSRSTRIFTCIRGFDCSIT